MSDPATLKVLARRRGRHWHAALDCPMVEVAPVNLPPGQGDEYVVISWIEVLDRALAPCKCSSSRQWSGSVDKGASVTNG